MPGNVTEDDTNSFILFLLFINMFRRCPKGLYSIALSEKVIDDQCTRIRTNQSINFVSKSSIFD
jgi:hypothetical protein